MAKKNKFKRNKSDVPLNIFDGGGIITDMYTLNISGPKLSQSGLPSSYLTGLKYGNMGNTSNVGSNLMSSLGNTALGMGAGIVGNLGGNLIAGGKSSGIGSTIGSLGNTIGSAAMMVNPLVGGAIMGGTSLLGGAFNAVFGSKLNKERIALAENEINAVKNFNADASNFDDLSLLIANATSIANFSKSDIGSDGWFSNKAKNKYKDLLAQKLFAEAWQRNSILNNATNLQLNLLDNLLLNYAAYGGLLDINNPYSDGGKIYIKPENRGKFTALKERTGKSATWFKEHGTPALKKMATFALNSRKWKHEDGGNLNDYNNYATYNNFFYLTQGILNNMESNRRGINIEKLTIPNIEIYNDLGNILDTTIYDNDYRNIYNKNNFSTNTLGNTNINSTTYSNKKALGGSLMSNNGDWSNGIILVNNGNTHENNKYEGVQMGVDPLGIPNLVEEGEVIWNDYVFSNRIPVPNAVRSKYKLRGAKNMTFADAAKKVSKESEEMPNDNIALRGLLDIMSKLAYEQEAIRELRNMNNKNKFKGGGPKYTKQQVGLAAWDAYLSSLKNDDNNILLRRPSASRFYDTTTLKPLDKIPSLLYYNLTRQSNNKTYNNNNDDLLDRDNLLRYAPVVGSAIGLGLTLLSKPNYSRADALALFAQNAGKVTPISYDPLGNYLTYRPNDVEYIANKMAALAAATRRGIMNTAGGNRAMALAGLAALDYSSLLALAEAIRQANESNFNRGILVETFNRGTNLYNSEAALKAAMANQEARMKASQLGLSGYSTAMLMKDAIDALRNASINANLTNLFDNLGQIGEEIYDKNRLKWMERKGVLRSDYFDTGKYRKKYGGHINKGGK